MPLVPSSFMMSEMYVPLFPASSIFFHHFLHSLHPPFNLLTRLTFIVSTFLYRLLCQMQTSGTGLKRCCYNWALPRAQHAPTTTTTQPHHATPTTPTHSTVSSTLYPPPSTIHHPPSTIHPPPSTLHPLPLSPSPPLPLSPSPLLSPPLPSSLPSLPSSPLL